jgi:hypothetical protein
MIEKDSNIYIYIVFYMYKYEHIKRYLPERMALVVQESSAPEHVLIHTLIN